MVSDDDDDTSYEEKKKEKISSILQITGNDLLKGTCIKTNLKFLNFSSINKNLNSSD
jgi:hypothetical protein